MDLDLINAINNEILDKYFPVENFMKLRWICNYFYEYKIILDNILKKQIKNNIFYYFLLNYHKFTIERYDDIFFESHCKFSNKIYFKKSNLKQSKLILYFYYFNNFDEEKNMKKIYYWKYLINKKREIDIEKHNIYYRLYKKVSCIKPKNKNIFIKYVFQFHLFRY